MSGLHGLYSRGGLLGAAAASALLSIGMPHIASVLVVVAGLLAMLAVAAPRFLRTGGDSEPGPFFVVPHGIVVLIGVLCLICFLAEGAMVDWSALFLTSERGFDAAHAGFGYGVFSITMTVGRFIGDRLVRRFGAETVLILGGLSAAAGFLLAVLGPTAFGALAGFALVGAGASNIVPVLFSAAGRQTAMPSGMAIAAVSSLGYAGILIGPAFLGFVANASSLSVALACLAGLVLAIPIAAPVILR
jgi:predicted MFS family arabinose efflux permease